MKTPRNPNQVHRPVAQYSHQIEVSGQQRWLVLSGQIGQRADGDVPPDPIEQLAVALDNIRRNLEAADMQVTDLVKLTIYLVGEVDTLKRREMIADWLGGHTPALTLLYVAGLAAGDYRVEIDAWACAEDDSRVWPGSVALMS